jgi:apolipoprotein N-acyltransferase
VPRAIKESFGLVLSAALLALPYHYGGLGPLAFVAFVPALFCIQGKTSGQVFRRFFFFGMVYYTLLGYWLNYVNVFGFLLLAAYLSLYFAFFALMSRSFLESSKIRNTVFVAAFWVLLEYLRGVLFSGFPWALLAYTQWKYLSVIQIADIIGAYGVSFFVLWVNVLLFQWLQRSFSSRHALFILAAMAVVLGYGTFRLHTREAFYRADIPKAELGISVLQGNIPQDQKWDARIKGIIFEKYKRLTFMAAMDKPDLVVWPETSFPGYLEDEPILAAQLRNTVRQARTSVLVGAPSIGDLEKELRFYNSAILYGPNGEEVGRYHKEHLVPFGEYVPFELLIGFLRNFVAIGHFSPGQEPVYFSLLSQYRPIRVAAKFSVLISYEDIFPDLVRDRCKAGADFLVNMSNDAWFQKSAAPYQHAQASVFRAVENRVPVVRATNTGYSCFISSEGRVTSSVKTNGEEIMVTGLKTQNIVLRKGRPFFTRYGDLFFWILLLLAWMAYREKQKLSNYARL